MNRTNSATKLSDNMSYILLFMLLAFSGNPAFVQNKYFLIIFGILLFTVATISTKVQFDFVFKKRLFYYVFSFAIIFLLQAITLNFISTEGVINFFVKIFVGALIVYLLGYNFREKYLNIMYFLSLISIVGFLINYNGFKIPAIIEVKYISSVILFGTHNLLFDFGPMRNSGMFWEPGAYAGYLTLIPLMYIGDFKELWILHKSKCIVLLIALLTTLSTTGYVVLYCIVIYFLMVKFRKKFFIYLIIPFILYGMYVTFMQLDFLGEKIESQSESTFFINASQDFSDDRFGALAFDLYYINKHPLIGNGLHSKTRYADHQFLLSDEESGVRSHGNGFSNFVASMGVISMCLIFSLIYKRLPFAKLDSMFVLLMLFLLLQGEQFLNYPLFLALPFILIPSKNEFNRIKDSSTSYLP